MAWLWLFKGNNALLKYTLTKHTIIHPSIHPIQGKSFGRGEASGVFATCPKARGRLSFHTQNHTFGKLESPISLIPLTDYMSLDCGRNLVYPMRIQSCTGRTFSLVQFKYITKSQQQSSQSALFCKVKTLQKYRENSNNQKTSSKYLGEWEGKTPC